MANMIVALSIGLAFAFAALWMRRPDVRVRVERPKYRFEENVRRYDRARLEDDQRGSRPS
jgi:hypothetical protein